ncbi:MAG: hypothetical protein E6778_14755 [Niallia nealsonii]|nr:hypothetical protein [Niallia nealsonii]
MAFVVGYGVALIGVLVALYLSKNKSKKRYIVWGVTLMVAVSPFLSFAIGLTYGSIVGNGWAIPGTILILFPIGFIIGLSMLLVGIFKKSDTNNSI